MPDLIKPTPELAYLQRHAALLVTNSRLRAVLIIMAVFLSGLTFAFVTLARTSASYKPMVIRINDVGHAEAITYSATEYRVQEAEIKYFLMDFIQKYYGRVRGTAKDDFVRSLYFMTPKLADERLSRERETKGLDEFILGIGDQIEVAINQISIEDLRQQPYRAVVSYDKMSYSQIDHQLRGKAKFTAHVQFIVLEKVPHSLIPVNPLGLTISYLREDQAFTDSKDAPSPAVSSEHNAAPLVRDSGGSNTPPGAAIDSLLASPASNPASQSYHH